MELLIVANAYYPLIGGAETHINNLAKNLAKKGVKVAVYTTYFGAEKATQEENWNNHTIKRFSYFNPIIPYTLSKELVSAVNERIKAGTIVHLQGYGKGIYDSVAKLCVKRNIPYVLTAHGFFHTKKFSFFKNIYERTLGKYLVKNASVCIALTAMQIDKYKSLGAKRIEVVPNGVDLNLFKNTKKKRNAEEILFVGRLSENKGIDILVKAFDKLKKEFPHAKLRIAGKDWGYKKELDALIKELNIKCIDFTGEIEQKDLIELYNTCGIFVLPSRYEGFGIVQLEAMACGAPVIATRAKGASAVIENGRNGILVEPDNADELYNATKKILTDDKFRKRIIANGTKLAQEYSWEKIADKYLEIYKGLK